MVAGDKLTEVGSLGHIANSRPPFAIEATTMPTVLKIARDSEEVKIFVVLPFARLVAWRDPGFFQRPRIPVGLATLELDEIVDECIAQRVSEQRLTVEGIERVRQAFRQHWALGRIWLVARGRQRGGAVDSSKFRDDLRKNVE